MRLDFALSGIVALGLADAAAAAQRPRIYSTPAPEPPPAIARALRLGGDDEPRAVLGISTNGSGSARDTLGVLVSSVVPNSPADKAGIEEGNRIASINGVSLSVAPADAGDREASNAMTRRLTRELTKVKPGDEVELRVYADGRMRSLTVRTANSDSLYSRRRVSRNADDNRPTLGIGVGSTGSRRDTLGVLVMFVDDSGPAARAGMEEGNRIAEINGVDLRVNEDDAGDDFVASTKVRRLQREMSTLHPGDEVELRVYSAGRTRTVRLRAARASDLPHRGHRVFFGGEGIDLPSLHVMPRIDGAEIGADVRRAIERALEASGRAIEGVGRGLGAARIYWQNDSDDFPRARVEPVEPIRIEPLVPGRAMTRVRAPARATVLSNKSSAAVAAALAEARSPAEKLASAAGDAVAVNVGGLRMVPVGEELAAYLGKGSERGLLVLEVPAWASNTLRAGDVVLRIDGHAVRAGDDFEEINVELPRERDTEITILRDRQRSTVTLPARR